MLKSIYDIQTVTDELDHAEGLNFGPDGLCYAGGEDGQLYRIDPDGALTTFGRTEGGIGGVCLDGDANLYICNYGAARVEKVNTDGTVSSHSAGTTDISALEPNYPVFDAEGFLFYSDSGNYYRPCGRLFVVRPDGTTEHAFGGHLHYPNGLAIDPSNNWLYVVQSTAQNLIRFPLMSEGRVGEPETYVRLPGVVPDGIAFAESGVIYVACYSPDIILRVLPDRRVETVVQDLGSELLNRPTNVAFQPGTTNLWFANFGGHSIRRLDVGEQGVPLHFPSG
ncbi:MAG: SMP-30/gluconolactonase/LRE family protein [Acidimicrobiia bacterium]